MTNKWASRVIRHGTDLLGRWLWVTLHGKRKEVITLVSAYRPNPGQVSSGQTTVWLQQHHKLAEGAVAFQDATNVDPREQCAQDLSTWTQNSCDRGEQVIILTDPNQSLTGNTEKYSLQNMLLDCNLVSAMEARHPGEAKNSTKEW